jgi:hypothetical protein
MCVFVYLFVYLFMCIGMSDYASYTNNYANVQGYNHNSYAHDVSPTRPHTYGGGGGGAAGSPLHAYDSAYTPLSHGSKQSSVRSRCVVTIHHSCALYDSLRIHVRYMTDYVCLIAYVLMLTPYIHASMHKYVRTCIHACMHTCIHTYVHTA